MPAHPPRRLPARLAVPSLLIAACLAAPVGSLAQSPHCGTSQWMQRKPQLKTSLRQAGPFRAVELPYRTLETAHFNIRYTLRGLNRVKTTAADKALTDLADSIAASLPPSLTGAAADSALYARLDARKAGHPLYISTMAAFFEKAYAYYADTLKMRAPNESVRSVYYEAPADPGGKYPVDVADIGTADRQFQGQEIYALTYPPGLGGMLMENDFLFNTRLGPDGFPVGDSISSRYQGRLIHNYASEWELGLKVTCYHELYHSVQFEYTPSAESFHLWYETSATGMEERKAPEVNDYLQYLPAYMEDLSRRGMRAFADGALSRYGNGIYYVFLAKELGEDFDTRIWTRLVANGNDIFPALETVYASYGRTTQELYSKYAAQLAFAGTDAANPLPAFSPDISQWPKLPRDTVDLLKAGTAVVANLPPLAIRGLHLPGSGGSGKALNQPDTLVRAALARLGPDTGSVGFLGGRVISLDAPGSGGDVLAALSNGHASRTATGLEVRTMSSRLDIAVYPYPNPMDRSLAGAAAVFSRLDRPATVTLYTERGSVLRALAFSGESSLWSWDLVDSQGRKVKPGLYYYQVDGGRLQPFYVK